MRFSYNVEHACLSDGKDLIYIMIEKNKVIQSYGHQKFKILVEKYLKVPFEFSTKFSSLYLLQHGNYAIKVIAYRGIFTISPEDFFFINCTIPNNEYIIQGPIQHIRLGTCYATGWQT